MKNDRDAAGDSNHCDFATAPLRELGSPCSQPCRSATVHHDHCPSGDLAKPNLPRGVAARHNARLRWTSPALVIPPDTSRSPDWLREGVRLTQGPTRFEERKRFGSSIAARNVSATTAPIPGIVMRRWQTGSSQANWRTCFSRPASSCRRDALACSIGQSRFPASDCHPPIPECVSRIYRGRSHRP